MKCPEATKPHSSECNKYLKCAVLPSRIISWITIKCQEGLIYDKNLRSCAIPGENWECYLENGEADEEDERNVYGIENLEISEDEPETNDNEFLEVIDDTLNAADLPAEARVDNQVDDDQSSGDGEIFDIVTPSASTTRMITTQLQRLTQLMQHVQDENNGVIDDEDITADDLNSFLATQKIQSDSSDYQKIEFHSSDKTPMPSNGRIHPDIISDILDQQNQLNSEAGGLTTLSMDVTTPKTSQRKPTLYFNRDPITDIQLKSGPNGDGMGSHQIVVNRPEGSVLFNVPSAADQNHHSPYLSEDILKTILEISKQMVTQNHQKPTPQASYAPQPFYYAVPVPYLSPQNNVQNYYSHEYRKNVTEEAGPVVTTKPTPNRFENIPSNTDVKLNQKADNSMTGYLDSYGYYHAPNAHQQQPQQQQYQKYTPQHGHQNYQNPNYYYQNYPSYTNGYTNTNGYQSYQPNYQYPTKNQFGDKQIYNQQYHFDGAYYDGNRPFVIESSAPSYVDHSIRQKPFRKESYATSYENNDEEGSDENIYDELELDEPVAKSDKDNLICSYVVQRQANQTDCFRYYVCNAKTKETISYTCPIFTAFNDQTKFCDSLSYAACKKTRDQEFNVYHNKKIYSEAQKALEQVKKESQKVERIASMVREESQKLYKRRNQYQTVYEEEEAPAYYPSNFAQVQRVQKPYKRQQPVTLAPFTTPRPKPLRKSTKRKKKKVKCRDVGNIMDPENRSSYWHCFKAADGRMKRINRKCTSNFVFCPTTRYCSPANSC